MDDKVEIDGQCIGKVPGTGFRVWQRLKALFKGRQKSPMEMWAEEEVRLAVEREQESERKDAEAHGRKYDHKGFSYGGEIYKSALRAYKCLLEDGHSGMSWAFAKVTLNRLMDHKPLTPLTGKDEEWGMVTGFETGSGSEMFQNVRYSSLFKTVDKDGNATYNDLDRVVCVDEATGDTHHLGIATREVDAIEPITFPYIPGKDAIKVYDRVFSREGRLGEFDTVGVLRAEFPDGSVHLINKFYKEVGREMVPISKDEYDIRLEAYESHKMDKHI